MSVFVTVGNGKFDTLVRMIDSLCKKKMILDHVVVQIGKGTYIPNYCDWFRFAPSLDSYYDEADIVVSHGGAGTVF